ncbi:alpha/beta fold hydrolase [Faunimonas sp. B44]|uniref:alpha/beta fold hydrolase n=1 Tax=Faunimonas sp. B44 TaxID=3461493 RepID=UPI00404493B0
MTSSGPSVDARECTARARDGTPIAYELRGRGRGRAVLVHALAQDRTYWNAVADELEGVAEVLILDCRGHGRSGKPPGPYDVNLFADDLADVMRDAGWDSAVVAGASMGGCVAMAFGAQYPACVQGLVLVDTTASYGPDAPAAWEERALKALEGGMRALVDFQESRWFSPGFLEREPEAVARSVDVFVRNDVAAYAEACRMLGRCDVSRALPDFTFPVGIVVGAEDYATPPAMAEEMLAAIPGAELTVLEGVRHFTPIEAPAAVAEVIARLCAAGRRA